MIRYSALKQELKSLAIEIHTNKAAFKNSQRVGTWRVTEELRDTCYGQSRLARHLLIAYSMLRGRTYEQVESRVSSYSAYSSLPNTPDMDWVNQIMDQHRITETAHEALRTCS